MTLLKEKNSEQAMGLWTGLSSMDWPARADVRWNREVSGGAGKLLSAGGGRELEVGSGHQRDPNGPVERLDALTSDSGLTQQRAAWFDGVREALEGFFMGVQQVLARDDLAELARAHRPEVLPAVEGIRERLVLVLEEAWELVYLLRRLNDAAEVSDLWLGQRIRKCIRSYGAVRKQATQLLCAIVWREPVKQRVGSAD